MNIGIDISQIVYEGTGVSRFTIGLIEAILEYDTTNKWTFFFSSFRRKININIFNKIKVSRHRFIQLPFSPSMLSFLWNTLHIVPIETFTGKLDVFICSDWTEPPSSCKKATIVHDFAYLRYPETVHPMILETQKRRMKWVKKESSYIVTPSIATQKDVSTFFAIPLERITPLYSGVIIQQPSQEIVAKVIDKYKISKPFILSVGKLEPRKNIHRLIEAFIPIVAHFAKNKLKNERTNGYTRSKLISEGYIQTKKTDWELLIVGTKGWDEESNKLKNDSVKFTGFVTENELHALYELCQFFVLPSLWEGFGYPVIEAMMHKKAVAASNNSSLVELVADHGILFDPLSTSDISRALIKLIDHPQTRLICAQKGFDYSQQFTWERYYDGLMGVIGKNPKNVQSIS